MNKKALSLAICLAMAIPTTSNALSLGEIESKSSLNQPFQGRINLLQTNQEEVKNLRIKVASPEVFTRVGIDRPAFLNNIRFRTVVQNGRPVILVSSSQPINEPFLNFLLEVSWPNGQLLKEYTVLLDPPALLRPNTAIASNSAGVRAEPKAQGTRPQLTQAQRQARAQGQSQGDALFQRQARQVLAAGQPRRAAGRAAPGNNYRVVSGDNLSKVAGKLGYSGVARDQMMVALFEKNRRAFSQGNMNNLKSGAVISRPSLQEAKSLSTRAAKSRIVEQVKLWKAERGNVASNTTEKPSTTKTARLEVLGKADTNANSSGQSGNSEVEDLNKKLALLNESLTTKNQENAELSSRVADLQSLLRKKERLIVLKSQQLTTLQESMSEKATEEAASSEPEVTIQPPSDNDGDVGKGIQEQVSGSESSQNQEIVRTEPEPAIVDNTPAPEPEVVEPEVEPETPTPSAFKPESGNDSSIMDLVTSPVGIAAGAGSLALLGGFAFMRRRKNKTESEGVEDFSDIIDNGLTDQEFDDDILSNNVINDTDFSRADAVDDQEVMIPVPSVDIDDGKLDDLIQEADVYIVYGLHDQAESEIRRALGSYPDSAALHAKLLENYKAAGDTEAFENATKDFLALESDEKQNYWDEICEWGNTLSPDNKLYDNDSDSDEQNGMGIAAAATGAAMVAGTAIAAAGENGESMLSGLTDTASEALDMDLNSGDLIQDGLIQDDLIQDTVLDELDNFGLNKTLDVNEAISDSLDGDGLSSGLDIIDLDDTDLSSGLDLDLGDADLSSGLDIDLGDSDLSSGLDIDLGDTDLSSDLDIDLDGEFDTTLVQDKLELDLGQSDFVDPSDLNFRDEPLDDLLNIDENGLDLTSIETDDIHESANLNLEIDSDGFNKIMPEQHAYKPSSNDIDLKLDGESDDILADFDDNLSFLDIDDNTEIGEAQIETKIDLARAYIDMGDIEGARSTLEEVIENGNDEQKRQAEELLNQNG